MAKLLIDNFKNQIDINLKDNYGRTALYKVIEENNISKKYVR